MTNRGEEGFSVIEAIVSFAIVSLVLVSLYEAIAGGYHGAVLIKQRSRALALATSQLAALGTSVPLQQGTRQGTYSGGNYPGGTNSAGTYSGGLKWRIQIDPLGEPRRLRNATIQAYRIRLRTFDRRDRVIVDLKTIKLGRIAQ